jgi:hypothetical protein
MAYGNSRDLAVSQGVGKTSISGQTAPPTNHLLFTWPLLYLYQHLNG